MTAKAKKVNANGTDGLAELTFDGSLTIQRAVEIKETVQSSMDVHDRVEIRFAEVDAVDLSFLQILCSAHRAAVAQGKELTVAGDTSGMYQQAINDAGLSRHVGCHLDPHKDCLWKESDK